MTKVNSTIYISGVDVVNGSAVLATQTIVNCTSSASWASLCCGYILRELRLDIKPYHPVESFGRDLQSSAKVETEVHPACQTVPEAKHKLYMRHCES